MAEITAASGSPARGRRLTDRVRYRQFQEHGDIKNYVAALTNAVQDRVAKFKEAGAEKSDPELHEVRRRRQ